MVVSTENKSRCRSQRRVVIKPPTSFAFAFLLLCLQSLSEEELTLEDAFSLLDEMPEELWDHEAARAVMSKMIKVLLVGIERLSAQFKNAKADAEAAVAVAVLRSKVIMALVGIIDRLGAGGIQGETAKKEKKQALTMAEEALGKALGPIVGLFEQGMTSAGHPRHNTTAFYELLPLRADVKKAMEVIIIIICIRDAPAAVRERFLLLDVRLAVA